MGSLVRAGKARAWGLCNDDAYGLARAWAASRAMGAPPPSAAQNDFSLVDRRASRARRPRAARARARGRGRC